MAHNGASLDLEFECNVESHAKFLCNLQVEQLDDGMIYFLASLPNESFDLLRDIFVKFVNAELKSQTVPRSKKGTTAKQLDLKGSQFKCLRGVELSDVQRLLTELSFL